MKKTLTILLCLVAVLFVSCTKKEPEKKQEPLPSPTAGTQTSVPDISESDEIQAEPDTQQTDDTTESDGVNAAELIVGSWQSDERIFSFLDAGECIYISDNQNIADKYSVTGNTLTIENANEQYTIESISKSKLVLKSEEDEGVIYRKLSHTKRESELTAESLTGTWISRIESGNTYIQFNFDLKDDGSAVFTMNHNGEKQVFKNASWSVVNGRLVLDNGAGGSSSKLKYSILKANENTLVVVMEKCAVLMVRE